MQEIPDAVSMNSSTLELWRQSRDDVIMNCVRKKAFEWVNCARSIILSTHVFFVTLWLKEERLFIMTGKCLNCFLWILNNWKQNRTLKSLEHFFMSFKNCFHKVLTVFTLGKRFNGYLSLILSRILKLIKADLNGLIWGNNSKNIE